MPEHIDAKHIVGLENHVDTRTSKHPSGSTAHKAIVEEITHGPEEPDDREQPKHGFGGTPEVVNPQKPGAQPDPPRGVDHRLGPGLAIFGKILLNIHQYIAIA
jgi:hypothetical protein